LVTDYILLGLDKEEIDRHETNWVDALLTKNANASARK
jgi:hypothetical protein